MKRILITDMAWELIQTDYNSGLSTRDLCKKYVMSGQTLANARTLNLFIPRSRSEAGKIMRAKKPRDYSEARNYRSAIVNYRADCAFKFNLSDYYDEFDFTLIESYGWYKPKNRGNNLYGVSRDHSVSVRYGFDNNLPPEHLAHPANCSLMQHSKNASKGKNNTMSYVELLKRITVWDEKYGL